MRILQRRAWVIAFVALAVFVVVLVYSRSLPPRYSTSASIEVTKAIASEGMEQWLYYKGHPIETAIRQIRSRACIEAALRDLKKIDDKSSENEISFQVNDVLSRLSIHGEENTNVITIAMQGPDKDNLAPYINAICRVYEKLEREWDRRADDEVITFLQERIAQYRRRLEAAEAQVIAYKSQNILKGISSDVASQFKMRNDLALQKATMENDIAEMRARRGAYSVDQSPEMMQLLRKRSETKVSRDAVLEQFTENHPSYQKFNDELKQLDKVIEDRRASYEQLNNDRVEQLIQQRERQILDIGTQLVAVEENLKSLPQEQVTAANLEMELGLSRNLYQMFWQRLESQKIIRQSKSGGVVLQGPAGAPVKIYPNERTHQTMGLAMGLLLGFAFAFLLETMDTSIRTIEEIEEFVGVPVLGVAPIVVLEPMQEPFEPGPGKLLPDNPGTIIHYHPRDPASEAYRALTSTLEFTFFNEGHRVLLIASATPQEGKTTSVSNIGIGLANSGKKTILLDCNLRHPGVTKIFGLSGHAGLAEALGGFVPWRVCAYPTMVENLDVIPTGSLPGQPVELIKNGLPNLLRELSTIYSAIIVDSPPVLPVADAAIISSMAGGTLLVYSQGRAPRDVLIRARTKIETAKGRVLGTFLNKVRPEGELGRNYYYYYYAYYPHRGGKGEASRVT